MNIFVFVNKKAPVTGAFYMRLTLPTQATKIFTAGN